MKVYYSFIFLILLVGCNLDISVKSDDASKPITGIRLIGSCDDIDFPSFKPNNNIYDSRNRNIGHIHLAFFEDNTYSIRYKFVVYDTVYEQERTYERDEAGKFSYTQQKNFQTSYYSWQGTITFYPDEGESWNASYNIGNLYQMKIQVDNGYIEFLLGGCYEYKRAD